MINRIMEVIGAIWFDISQPLRRWTELVVEFFGPDIDYQLDLILQSKPPISFPERQTLLTFEKEQLQPFCDDMKRALQILRQAELCFAAGLAEESSDQAHALFTQLFDLFELVWDINEIYDEVALEQLQDGIERTFNDIANLRCQKSTLSIVLRCDLAATEDKLSRAFAAWGDVQRQLKSEADRLYKFVVHLLALSDRRFAESDRRFAESDRRFAESDRRFVESDRRFAESDRRFAESDRRFTESNRRVAESDQRFADVDRRLTALEQRRAARDAYQRFFVQNGAQPQLQSAEVIESAHAAPAA